jgi:hypothetical protein
MNMEERQHPLQAPQGTSAPPPPDRSDASVPRSQKEKLPAGTPFVLVGTSFSHFFKLLISGDLP